MYDVKSLRAKQEIFADGLRLRTVANAVKVGNQSEVTRANGFAPIDGQRLFRVSGLKPSRALLQSLGREPSSTATDDASRARISID